MAQTKLDKEILNEIFMIAPHLTKLPMHKMSMNYDEVADVLYISFNRPQNATDSEMLDNGVLLRYKQKELVGMTVFEASKR
ncbi:MAG: hypothetical protein IEMM0008_0774 [bacterium]|nr:MAG: hypothetical protein IEMM0008_0774 [bacterium]